MPGASRVLGFFAAAAGVALASCGTDSLERIDNTQGAVAPGLPDAGTRAYVVRSSLALLGRPPRDEAEAAAFEATMVGPDPIRSLHDFLMSQEDFTRHWTSVLMDMLRVGRTFPPDSTGRTNEACWNAVTADLPGVAQHVATQATNAPFMTPGFTMLDVLRGAVQVDDNLRAPLRGNLFAAMSRPLPGNQIREANIRADFWSRFENTYLNRQVIQCLGCHNTAASVTDASSGWDRFAQLPDQVELATLGRDDGFVPPPDLQADFRYNGVANTGTGELPWGLTSACGDFQVSPTPQSDATGNCPTTPPDLLPVDDFGAQQDVCFPPNPALPLVRRWPRATFGLAVQGGGSVHRLDQMFLRGADSLAVTGLPADRETVRTVEDAMLPTQPPTLVNKGERGFAILVAENLVERVWTQVFGHRLTLAHHFPRHPIARDAIYDLARELLAPSAPGERPWSLKYLLRNMLRRPEFNAAAGVGAEYPMGVLFNPWVLADPRILEPILGEGCDSATPKFESCVKNILVSHACTACHGAGIPGAAPFENTFASITNPAFTIQADGTADPCATICPAEVPVEGSDTDMMPFDCSTVLGRPAGKFALRVNCTDNALAMPPIPGVRLSRSERLAVYRWVQQESPQGGFPTPRPPTAAETGNSVGDRAQWKPAFQLIATLGSGLGFANTWSQPFPFPQEETTDPVGGYPSVRVAKLAGQYMDDASPGGRGFSLLSFLEWEIQHTVSGETCRFGAGPDRIDQMVTEGAQVETLVNALKQSIMGEGAIADDEERTLLGAVLAPVVLSDTVSAAAGNATNVAQALRRACNVFIRSPLFMLSYLEPTGTPVPVEFGPGGRGRGRGRGPGGGGPPNDDFILPDLCGGRLDCRTPASLIESTLSDCWDDRRSCRFRRGAEATERVRDGLVDLRLPVEPPVPNLEQALADAPWLVPSENDPRLDSPLLILPLQGGRVAVSRGDIWSFISGRWRRLRVGDTIAFAEALFVPRGAHLKILANGQVFETDSHGMEDPPEGEDGADHGGHRHHRHRRHRRHHHHHDRNAPDVWIVVANGAKARTTPHPGLDPRIVLGDPLGPAQTLPQIGSLPVWAKYGQGGLWYTARP